MESRRAFPTDFGMALTLGLASDLALALLSAPYLAGTSAFGPWQAQKLSSGGTCLPCPWLTGRVVAMGAELAVAMMEVAALVGALAEVVGEMVAAKKPKFLLGIRRPRLVAAPAEVVEGAAAAKRVGFLAAKPKVAVRLEVVVAHQPMVAQPRPVEVAR